MPNVFGMAKSRQPTHPNHRKMKFLTVRWVCSNNNSNKHINKLKFADYFISLLSPITTKSPWRHLEIATALQQFLAFTTKLTECRLVQCSRLDSLTTEQSFKYVTVSRKETIYVLYCVVDAEILLHLMMFCFHAAARRLWSEHYFFSSFKKVQSYISVGHIIVHFVIRLIIDVHNYRKSF